MALDGKVAVVTGSTSGIGLAVAEALAKQGARVVINSFTDSAQDHGLAQALAEKHGVAVRYVAADMADPEACAYLIAQARQSFGPVEILVNNAGIQHVAPIEAFPVERWNAILAVNLSSSFHTIRAAVPEMKAVGWGRIINIASAHGVVASPYKSAYVAAKHGVVGLTKAVALELAEAGVTCNAICPAYVMTPLVEKQIPDQMTVHGMDRETVVREIMLSRQPTRQFVTPEEIGAMVTYLCSDAARQVTGTSMLIDGGWTAM